MRVWLALAVGSLRLMIEGRERSETAAPFWDGVVRRILGEEA